MMRISIVFGSLLAMVWGLAEAQTLRYGDRELVLRDRARACYLAFVQLYDATLYADTADGARCLKLDYLRDFDRDQLRQATEAVFVERNGEQARARFAGQLLQIVDAYGPVQPGDSYQFCVAPGRGGEMLRDGRVVARVGDDEFAERFMRIWVQGERAGRPAWAFSRCPGVTL